MTETLDVAAFESLVISFGFVLTRVSAFIVAGPLPNHGPMPNQLKVALCVALSLFWLPDETPPLSEAPFGVIVLSALGEFAIGFTLGTMVKLLFLPCTIAGSYVSQELGFNLGQVTDPTSGNPTSETVLLFESLGILLFWVTNADHFVWRVLGGSILYIDTSWDNILELGNLHVGFFARAHELGILMIAPVAAIMWIALMALSLLMRIWPQVTLFSFGMGARLVIGLSTLLLFFPQITVGIAKVIISFAEALEDATLY